NEKMTLEDLLYGLMLRSGNDAAVAIAEHVGGSEEGFVYLMNETADYIGMTDTYFMNAHGLDENNHYSTAYDMALLRSEEHTSELQSRFDLVCRLLLEKKKIKIINQYSL